MEETSSLFSLSIDPATKAHLSEMAKWARFLAITGFIFLPLMVLTGIYSSSVASSFEEGYRAGLGMSRPADSTHAAFAVVRVIMAVIAFFPLLFTFRFANQMRSALNSNNQTWLNASFQNLKICYRYLGIITIISLVLMSLGFFFSIIGLAS